MKKKNSVKKPLKRSIIAGCVMFVMVLCLMLGLLNYFVYSWTLYGNYEHFITNTLNYVAANIDVDDLEQCIETGVESEKFKQLQTLLDSVKENVTLDFIYIIVPLNANDTDNIKNVMAGVTQYEYENESDTLVSLNMLTGDSYSSQTAQKYLDAFNSGELTFIEEAAQWGEEYTGIYPLIDSKGNKVASLCMDVDINEIYSQLYAKIAFSLGTTVIVGALFTLLFIRWTRENITEPIMSLEKSVAEYTKISLLSKSSDELKLEVPKIDKGNEVESLSNAILKMSEDIGAYARSLEEANEESKKKSVALSEALATAEEANRAKTVFLSNMSHEIRTPMNAIIGLDKIALDDSEISESTRDYLEKIGASANHLLRIINDILDMSRIESGRMTIKSEQFSIAKTLEQVNSIIIGQCRAKGLDYDCRVLGNVDEFYIGDDMKLRQILINILGNSVKFTNEGSVVMVIERIARFDGKATLRFIIKDTGIGMSKEFLPKIFDSFSQEEPSAASKYGTTGLGMAITKSLVELMNGDISVESEKGKGTSFTVTVTLKETEVKRGFGEDFDIDPSKMTVLVIDDNEVDCEHARLILSQTGVACETAASGEEALKMVELRKARREPYSLILVDWRMPVMDGIETTRKIRSVVGDESVIVILTAYNWDDVSDEAAKAGVDSFVPKPLFAAAVMNEYKSAYMRRNMLDKPKKADLNGKRILLAEDVEINSEIMLMVLGARGMKADVAKNGMEAVDMFSAQPEGYYDAILMDMRMPVMDGLEATGIIRKLDRSDSRKIPIIALTANAFDEDVQRSLQAGLNAHLSKPVEPDSLYKTLESLIED